MFKIVSDRVVKSWPATANIPVDGGKVETETFTVDLKLIDADEFAKLSRQGDGPLMKEVLVGWSGIGDKDDKPLAFTPDNVAAAAKNGPFSQAVFAAYMEANSGRGAEKNS